MIVAKIVMWVGMAEVLLGLFLGITQRSETLELLHVGAGIVIFLVGDWLRRRKAA